MPSTALPDCTPTTRIVCALPRGLAAAAAEARANFSTVVSRSRFASAYVTTYRPPYTSAAVTFLQAGAARAACLTTNHYGFYSTRNEKADSTHDSPTA